MKETLRKIWHYPANDDNFKIMLVGAIALGTLVGTLLAAYFSR